MATARTVSAVLATVEAADAAASLTELPGLLLPALAGLVGADSALWTEMDVTTCPDYAVGRLPGQVIGYPEPLLTEELAPALRRHARDFPLTRHTRPGADARKMGTDEMLAMELKPGSLHVCVCLHRAGRDFPAAAVGMLAQLSPLLRRRVSRLAAGPAAPGTASAPQLTRLTPRQRQVLRLVALGLTDTAIGHRLDCSPRTVDKHLEHIYRQLGVSCRTAAIAAVRSG